MSRKSLEDSDQRTDIVAFMAALTSTEAIIDYAAKFKRLLEIINIDLPRDREGVLSDLLDNTMALAGCCLLRMNQHVADSMHKNDQADRFRRHSQPPGSVTETLLPKILELTRQLLEIEQTRVSLAHQREVTRAKKIDNLRKINIPTPRLRNRKSRAVGTAAANGHGDPLVDSQHGSSDGLLQTSNGKVENPLQPWQELSESQGPRPTWQQPLAGAEYTLAGAGS
jgi:hypothetical protein